MRGSTAANQRPDTTGLWLAFFFAAALTAHYSVTSLFQLFAGTCTRYAVMLRISFHGAPAATATALRLWLPWAAQAC